MVNCPHFAKKWIRSSGMLNNASKPIKDHYKRGQFQVNLFLGK